MNRRLSILTVLIMACAACLCGCATYHEPVVLDPIGPPPHASRPPAGNGFLMVFSAHDPGADLTGHNYRDPYRDYKLLSADGTQPVQLVVNDDGKMSGRPRKLELPAGSYRVVAPANGYGWVTVPVVIEPRQLTTVHLEGSFWWPRSSSIFGSDPVRLPGGEIAGWRAPGEQIQDH